MPGLPLHVIQRGNNRQAMFASDDDFIRYRNYLVEAADRNRLAIHAYVFMTNHVHLLATPASLSSIPKTMQSLGRRFVRYFNKRYERTGTLLEGRYRAMTSEDERYLLTCMRYIELNPVRAGIAASPNEYRWSSYRSNAWGARDPLVRRHDILISLGATWPERHTAYRTLFHEILPQSTLEAIRDATNKGRALGNPENRL